MEHVIYMYTDKFNGKIYIGQTTNELRRKHEHKCAYGGCKKFHQAIREKGYDNFSYEVLYKGDCSRQEINIKEQYFIDKYDATNPEKGYNTLKGGGTPRNYELYCQHLSKSLTGRHLSEEEKIKIENGQTLTGVYVDDIYFKSIRKAADYFNFDRRCLAYCLKHNKNRIYKGHKIKYANE